MELDPGVADRNFILLRPASVGTRAQVKQMGERIKGDLLDHVTRTVYGKRIRQKLQVSPSVSVFGTW